MRSAGAALPRRSMASLVAAPRPAAQTFKARSTASAGPTVATQVSAVRSSGAFALGLPRSFHASAVFAAETVKVPQMAESISEGTLKQWNKKKGDYVEADEEVAVIETDKVGLVMLDVLMGSFFRAL